MTQIRGVQKTTAEEEGITQISEAGGRFLATSFKNHKTLAGV